MRRVAEELLPNMLSPRSRTMMPDVVAKVAGMMGSANPDGAAAALRGRADRRGYEDTLGDVDAPAALVFGSDDAYATRADADLLDGLLARSCLAAGRHRHPEPRA
jgi:hypothetical protein